MKMFKKIMAVALVGVMALSMLTGCALGDKIDEKALVKALKSDTIRDYINNTYGGAVVPVF